MTENPLGYEKISKLLKNFAVPSIVASLVGSIYNIVDQIFIGRGVGYLGNAATNVCLPVFYHLPCHCTTGRNWQFFPCFPLSWMQRAESCRQSSGKWYCSDGNFRNYLFAGWRNFSAFAPKGIWGNDSCISLCKAVCQHNIDWNAVSHCNEWYEQFDSSRWKTKGIQWSAWLWELLSIPFLTPFLFLFAIGELPAQLWATVIGQIFFLSHTRTPLSRAFPNNPF